MGSEALFDRLVEISPGNCSMRSFDQKYIDGCWNMGKELEDYAENEGEGELDKALLEFKDQFNVDLVGARRFYNSSKYVLRSRAKLAV